MPDEKVEFARLIATLKEGRHTVAEWLDLLDAEGSDLTTIHRHLKAARDLADLAETLAFLMMDRGAHERALQDAHDLAAFFCATEEYIEAKLGPDRE